MSRRARRTWRADAVVSAILRFALLFSVSLTMTTALAQGSSHQISEFFGRFAGTGIVNNSDATDASMTLRNLDVEIRGARGDGFQVSWTSLIRKFEGDVPTYTRKGLKVDFVPSERPGVYQERSLGNPLDGEPLIWARHRHPTLTVYQLVPSERGGFEILSYERTLTDEGMNLLFRRLIDGEEVRSVEGMLKREAN